MWLILLVALSAPVEERLLDQGAPVPFTPGAVPARVVCDDTATVRVEDAGDHFVVTGLRQGSTLCSFSPVTTPGLRRVYRFTVR